MAPSFLPSKLGALQPILPQSTGRYDVGSVVRRDSSYVEAGSFIHSRDFSYLPPQWSSSVHPEGKMYFYRNEGLRVVTEADLYIPGIAEQICAWVEEAEKQALEQDITLPASVELYLQLDRDDCNYYFVDNTAQTVFWLTRLETSELGLLPVVSDSHLKVLLEVQYWTHVENFCNHYGGLPQKCINELIYVFSRGLADNLTSHLTTFPYDTKQTQKFLDLLISSREGAQDDRTVCFIARLRGSILYNRYETYYGQDQARLSRDCAIISDDKEENKSFKPILSFITLKTYETYDKRLSALSVGRSVYGHDWHNFAAFSAKSWQQCIIASAGLLFVHCFSFFLPSMPFAAYLSASLATLSIITAIVLIHYHEELNNTSASLASEYLESIYSPHFNFQCAAFFYALPRSFLLWSLLVVFVEWTINLCRHMYLPQASLLVAIIILIFLSFLTLRRPLSRPRTCRRRRLGQSSDA